MKKALRIFALLTAASMLIWIAGCGGDEDEEEVGPAPNFVSWSVTEGQEVAGNASIIATFDKPVASAEITVAGAAGTTVAVGKTATWTPTGIIPPGAHAVTVTAEDSAGQALEGAVPVNITAVAADTTPPALGTCDPKNGASGVDPADYPEKIVVGFSEALSSATVTVKDPDFKSADTLVGDTLEIAFLQYTMPNETPFTITIEATDAANNTATLEYTFETMAKEQ